MTSNPVFIASLRWGGILALVLGLVGGTIGWFTDSSRGLVSALIGTGIAVVFLSITAISILIANRYSKSDLFVPLFFGIVMGGWILKFVIFIVLALILRQQPWVNGLVLFLSIVAGVIGSLVVDAIVVMKSRLPYASDVKLPGDDSPEK